MSASPYHRSARELGPREKVFTSPAPTRQVFPILLFLAAPGVALLTGYQSAPGQVFAGSRLVNGGIGAALVAFAIYCVVLIHRKATLRVDAYENGLIWFERGVAREIFYRDIAEIKGAHTSRQVVGAEVARTNVYTLRLEDGRTLVFTNMLRGGNDLAARIELAVAENILPRVRQAFQAAESFAFGPLKLWIDRVERGEKVIFWDDVESVAIENGTVTIHGKNKDKIEIDWSALPNANILRTIVKERAKLEPAS